MPKPKRKVPEWATLIVAGLALPISLLSLFQSMEANRIASESQKNARDEIRISRAPTIELYYFFARSIGLLNEDDISKINRFQLVARPVPSRFWRAQRAKYQEGGDQWYLFLMIANRGPGVAKNIRISEVVWVPAGGFSVPAGLTDLEAPLGVLQANQAHSFLVDVVQSYDPSLDLYSQPGIHFQSISVAIDLEDAAGALYRFPQMAENWKGIVPMDCSSGC